MIKTPNVKSHSKTFNKEREKVNVIAYFVSGLFGNDNYVVSVLRKPDGTKKWRETINDLSPEYKKLSKQEKSCLFTTNG